MSKALLFIPDISGFTSFVNQTEAKHQNHILEELLELLIDSNTLGLKLAEIEGDALFYYQDENVPELQAVIEMAENMYIRFHNHLRYYDTHRLCHCGACQNATGLTIKFVIHYGEISFLKIKDRVAKPHGIRVIEAHRLLKNAIVSDEYILRSETTLELCEEDIFSQSNGWTEMTETYGDNDVGEIKYAYRDIHDLRSKLASPKALKNGFQSEHPVRYSIIIDKEAVDLFEMILDHKKRVDWSPFIDDIQVDKDHLNHEGQVHTCVIQGNENEVVSVNADFGKDAWVLGEKGSIPILGDIFTYYILRPLSEQQSEVTFEAHVKPSNLLAKLFNVFFRFKMSSIQKEMAISLKKYAEQEELLNIRPLNET